MAFGEIYSALYDRFYRDKDYPGECDLLEALWSRHSKTPRTVLDLGCGTGGHALELARRGYRVTGVDRSRHMIELARAKMENEGLEVGLEVGELTALELGTQFDAAICMFAVLGYVTANDALEKALSGIRRHLKEDGMLVLDCWSGPAVLSQRPEPRVASFDGDDGGRVLRLVTPSLDIMDHVVKVKYHVLHTREELIVKESTESHRMRFFFPQELVYFLSKAGFERIDFFPFGDLGRALTPQDWNMLVVAR